MKELVIFSVRHLETDQEVKVVLYENGVIETFVDNEPYASIEFDHLVEWIEYGKEWLEIWRKNHLKTH